MNAHIYCAALYCDDCANKIREALRLEGNAPENPQDETSFDSDDYPKGPFKDGGGEADCPQHCDGCRVFLENPLTSDGAEYVAEALLAGFLRGRGDKSILREWEQFYDVRDNLREVMMEAFEEWLYPATEAQEQANA